MCAGHPPLPQPFLRAECVNTALKQSLASFCSAECAQGKEFLGVTGTRAMGSGVTEGQGSRVGDGGRVVRVCWHLRKALLCFSSLSCFKNPVSALPFPGAVEEQSQEGSLGGMESSSSRAAAGRAPGWRGLVQPGYGRCPFHGRGWNGDGL